MINYFVAQLIFICGSVLQITVHAQEKELLGFLSELHRK